jgi:hypothetical protein
VFAAPSQTLRTLLSGISSRETKAGFTMGMFLLEYGQRGMKAEVIMPHFKEISNPNRVHRSKKVVV